MITINTVLFTIMCIVFVVLLITAVRLVYLQYYNITGLEDTLRKTLIANEHMYLIFHDINERITYADRKLKEIDVRGSYSSDDEVGFFFVELQRIQELLNTFSTYFIKKNDTDTNTTEDK